jgi:hypothetical protein
LGFDPCRFVHRQQKPVLVQDVVRAEDKGVGGTVVKEDFDDLPVRDGFAAAADPAAIDMDTSQVDDLSGPAPRPTEQFLGCKKLVEPLAGGDNFGQKAEIFSSHSRGVPEEFPSKQQG